jgi:anthranilate phosphoribosyltransferase
LNSAAALVVAGRFDDLAAGAARAMDAIDSGAAKDVLRALIAITNEAGPGD